MAQTTIEWTATPKADGTMSPGYTFNPWWGCVKVSPGCEHCYAETLANRFGNNIWGPSKTTTRRVFEEKHWHYPLKWDRAALNSGTKARVFSGSMCDVFEENPYVEGERAKLIALIELTPHLQWLLLTKRPQNIMGMLDEALLEGSRYNMSAAKWLEFMGDWVWMGTSVEDQQRADERIPHLLNVPSRVRFLSVEPLLGPVDLWGARYPNPDGSRGGAISTWANSGVQWVIVGGESGPGKRPMELDWARSIRDDCKAAGVAFFFKQIDKVISIPSDLLIREFPYTGPREPAVG